MGKIILRIFAHSCFQSSGYGESHNDLRTRSIWPLTGAMLTEDVKKLSFDSRNHKVHLVIRFSGKQIVNEMCGYYVGSKLVKVRKAETSMFPWAVLALVNILGQQLLLFTWHEIFNMCLFHPFNILCPLRIIIF